METITERKIIQKLEERHVEVEYIKNHMVDVDTLLTPDEELAVEEALAAYKAGKTASLEELKRELAKKKSNEILRGSGLEE